MADDWRPRRVDLATVNGRCFTFSSGFGLDASVVKRVDARPNLKHRLRQYYFTYAAMTTFLRRYVVNPPRVDVEVDGRDPPRGHGRRPERRSLHLLRHRAAARRRGRQLDGGTLAGVRPLPRRPGRHPDVAYRMFSARREAGGPQADPVVHRRDRARLPVGRRPPDPAPGRRRPHRRRHRGGLRDPAGRAGRRGVARRGGRAGRAHAHPPRADRRARCASGADRAPARGAGRAIARLTPLQGQHPPAPYIALAARLEGFARADLEAALAAGTVVKTTIMRHTLHLAAAADYPAYAQLTRQAHMRTWRRRFPELDEARAVAGLRRWLAVPRGNDEIRERVAARWPEIPRDPWSPIGFVRDLVPLVRSRRRALERAAPAAVRRRPAAPTGRRGRGRARLARYLTAFGPASLRDAASWAGVAQRDLAVAAARPPLVRHRDEHGADLLDLPDLPLRPPRPSCRCACSPTGSSRCWPMPSASASSRPRSPRCS